MSVATSPKITGIAWGHVDVDGRGRFGDVKVFPGGAREWDWTETGTQHLPGVQPADVEELIEHGARIVVLSRGMLLSLQIQPSTLRYLDEHDATAHVLGTVEAVELYNELASSEPVGALIHSTC